MTTIPEYLFSNNNGLKEYTVPNYINKIDYHAFNKCERLSKLYIYNNVTEINDIMWPGESYTIIYCYSNSAAHLYAEENKNPYVLLDIDPNNIINIENLLIYKEETIDTPDNIDDIIDSDNIDDTDDTDDIDDIDDINNNFIIGDASGDNIVDSADALMVLRYSVGLGNEVDYSIFVLMDVNGDGNVDSSDALEILRYSVGLSTSEKVGKLFDSI